MSRERELLYFRLLDREQQKQALRRLVASGASEQTAAAASGLSVEQIRQILADAEQAGRK